MVSDTFQCFLTDAAGEVIKSTYHSCSWVYGRTQFAWTLELLIYALLWIIGIGLGIGFIVWIFWITDKTKRLEKQCKRSRNKR